MKLPPAKLQPTREILGKLYDETEKTVDFANCLWLATRSAMQVYRMEDAGLDTVVDDLCTKLKAIKQTLHDLVEWAE